MPVPSQHWAFASDLVPTFEHDPEQARALLEEAGYGDGFTLTFSQGTSAEFAQRAEILQAQLAEVGVQIEVLAQDGTAAVDTYFRNKQTDILNSSMTSRPDPSITFQTMFAADSFYNTGQYAPEGLDALLDAARAAQTTEQRVAAFEALNEAVVEHALWVPLLYPASITAWRTEFAGFTPSLIGKPDFLTVHLAG
jgi:ABC-type transport system substrate-binding protein